MDEHRPTASDSAVKRGSTPDNTVAGLAKAPVTGDVLSQAKNAAGEVIEHAKGAAEEVIVRAKSAAGDALTSFAQDVAEQAPNIARRVRDQAGATAETLYRESGEFLSPKVRAYPLTALVAAGVVGYSLGYFFSRR